jgi:long-chain acyl-CoA synthetase
MLDLRKYSSIGEALREALETYACEICLIESNRGEETHRLAYRHFKERALPFARGLQDLGVVAGSRVSIIMTNQSKWLISAYALHFCGAVMVPLDYQLKPEEHWALLEHAGVSLLIVEYGIWRRLANSPDRSGVLNVRTVLVTEAPEGADLYGAQRWEETVSEEAPVFVPRKREDLASIVYSSGTGGNPKGCMISHGSYLVQCTSLTAWYPFAPGDRYLSILPTNHSIDFMVGFFGPFICGAAVVHLRSIRPDLVREAFAKYQITYVTVVPLVLKNLQEGLQARFDKLTPTKRRVFETLRKINMALTKDRPRLSISRLLLKQVHAGFGGQLKAIIVGGAFSPPQNLQFFYDLGIPVVNAYGCTEGGTGITVNDLKPFRADTVGKPLPGIEVRIDRPDAEGIGEVAVRGKTLMIGYLNDPELTARTLVDGWLMTGDMGSLDSTGHLKLYGRKKNMIVTEEGKNVYAEDVESVFKTLPVKDSCVFAANYIWPQRSMAAEKLVLVVQLEPGQEVTEEMKTEIVACNNRLTNYKRVHGYILWHEDFPINTSRKLIKGTFAERLGKLDRDATIKPI